MPDDDEGPRSPYGDRVKRAVRAFREAKRMPYTELSERLTALGRPIPVLGLRRIEHGERRVDVDDLAVLARALSVPPLALLFAVGIDEQSEILPGAVVPTWRAVKYFTAEAPYPATIPTAAEYKTESEVTHWLAAAGPFAAYRRHEELAAEWHKVQERMRREQKITEAKPAGRSFVGVFSKNLVKVEDELVALRSAIRERGFMPPPLPDSLKHLDDLGQDEDGVQ